MCTYRYTVHVSSGYPMDEFDRAGQDMPVGVHRPRSSPWRFVFPLVVVLLVCAFLAWGVVHVMSVLGGGPQPAKSGQRQSVVTSQSKEKSSDTVQSRVDAHPSDKSGNSTQIKPEAPAQSKPEESPKPPAAQKVDKHAKIVVLNGTGRAGLAAEKVSQLKNDGFPGVTGDNAVGWATTVSVVYYSDPELKGTADELARILGVGKVEKDEKTVFPTDADIAVILR